MHKLRKTHLNIEFHLLRYLKNSSGKGVCFVKSDSLSLIGFVDIDWAKCLATCRYVKGYLVYF